MVVPISTVGKSLSGFYTNRVKNSCVNFIVPSHVQENVGFTDVQVFNGIGIAVD
jgi:hypothetical protein